MAESSDQHSFGSLSIYKVITDSVLKRILPESSSLAILELSIENLIRRDNTIVSGELINKETGTNIISNDIRYHFIVRKELLFFYPVTSSLFYKKSHLLTFVDAFDNANLLSEAAPDFKEILGTKRDLRSIFKHICRENALSTLFSLDLQCYYEIFHNCSCQLRGVNLV